MDLSQKPVDIRIGKKGISESLINEIKVQLKKKKLLKLKFLSGFLNSLEGNRKQIMRSSLEIITKFSNSEVLEIRGNTAIIKEKGKNNKHIQK